MMLSILLPHIIIQNTGKSLKISLGTYSNSFPYYLTECIINVSIGTIKKVVFAISKGT